MEQLLKRKTWYISFETAGTNTSNLQEECFAKHRAYYKSFFTYMMACHMCILFASAHHSQNSSFFSHLLQILGHCCKNNISHASVWSLPGYPSCSGLAGTGTQPLDPGEGKKPQQGSPWCVSTRVWPSHTKKTTSFELIWNKVFFIF